MITGLLTSCNKSGIAVVDATGRCRESGNIVIIIAECWNGDKTNIGHGDIQNTTENERNRAIKKTTDDTHACGSDNRSSNTTDRV
jgi:hypothetical protein